MTQAFIKTEKIRFQHIDYAGIVFYPRFLEMLNGLVEDFFEEILHLPFDAMHKTHGIPTVDLQVKFKNPARLGQELRKKLLIQQCGRSSIRAEFTFELPNGDTCLHGQVTLVYVQIADDRKGIKSAEIPPEMREKMQPYILQD